MPIGSRVDGTVCLTVVKLLCRMGFSDLFSGFNKRHMAASRRVVGRIKEILGAPYRAKAKSFMKEENRVAIIVLFVIIAAAIVVGDAIPAFVFGLICAAVGGAVICYIIVKNDLW